MSSIETIKFDKKRPFNYNSPIGKLLRKYDYLLAGSRFKFRELLFSKRAGKVEKELIPFSYCNNGMDSLPEIDVQILNTNIYHDYSYNGIFIDVLDFKKKVVERYNISSPHMTKVLDKCHELYPKWSKEQLLDFFFYDTHRAPHTAHSTPDGYLCASNIYGIYLVDPKEKESFFVPEDYSENIYLYSETGSFSSDYKYYYFYRWPFEEVVKIRNRKKEDAKCEIGRVRLVDRKVVILGETNFVDEGHQVSCTRDDKYLLLAGFNINLSHLVPEKKFSSVGEEIAEYKEAGKRLSKVLTFDQETLKSWETILPGAPTLAHFEFDLDDLHVAYIVATNIFIHPGQGLVCAGKAIIYKLKIENGKTIVASSYTGENCYRASQHRLFKYKGKNYMIYGTTPNKLQIINTDDMTLWRNIQILPEPDLEFKDGFATISDQFPLSMEIPKGSPHIVIGHSNAFYVYDLDQDKILDYELKLPHGKGYGHTRKVGE